MRAILAANVLVAALGAGPNVAAADEKACPIARVVARVQSVAGDAQKAQIKRAPTGDVAPATPGACVLYGERLEVGPEAVVTLETTNGVRHVGGQYDPVFAAPEAVEAVSPGVSSYVGALYRSLFAGNVMTAAATGRASLLDATDEAPDQCVPAQEGASPLIPLDRLAVTRQRIGADLSKIIAAWKPSAHPHSVRAILRGKEGGVISQAETCSSGHVALPLRPGDIHANETLTLEVVDGRGGKLTYELIVVEPKDLPLPPANIPSQWLVAAWRLAAGPPDTRLDSLARLQTAPPDALAAQAISEAVWNDSKL
jgi:hypothetical protein